MDNVIFVPRKFLSTLSLRRATNARPDIRRHGVISIHALLAESDTWKCGWYVPVSISIHALLAESDQSASYNAALENISIHALLAESDSRIGKKIENALRHFYPRSPCGERHNINSSVNTADQISIHALLAESDNFRRAFKRPVANFYPRSPCGERQMVISVL